ncbi:Spc97 / Spc98 family domain containing protein [Naviculisporaceae sp. PSN 640]
MAYLNDLASLTDELISAIASSQNIHKGPGQRFLEAHRESTFRTLRYHNFIRTNQFEVEDHLNGHEERFRVTGRDVLADEFRKRLDALAPLRNKWSPDVLHFILELADQPAQKSDVADLYRLTQPEEETQPKLRWEDIAREDGWQEERALWRNIDYRPDSDDEDDDLVEDLLRSRTSLDSLSTTTSTEDHHESAVQGLAAKTPEGDNLLDQVKESQAWRQVDHAVDGEGRSKKVPISTLQLLRESLFMLGGLETSFYGSNCEPVSTHQLIGVSWQTHKALISSFAECGRKILPLRQFVSKPQQVPLLQVFQDSLQKALHLLDRKLAEIQSRYASIKSDTVVSLLSILSELGPFLSPLYVLSSIVRQLQEERNAHAFRYLELLYDAVGIAQIEGSQATYELLGDIFFDCFQVYLKPIRLWMEEGKLLPGDRTFFVSESSTRQPLHLIWENQFNLLKTPDGSLHAPRFLQPAITRIFTTGKSIVILKHLKRSDLLSKTRIINEPPMDFTSVCQFPGYDDFAPFSELFNAAFSAWIQSKHHSASATLRKLLFDSYGLSQGLDALQCIYLNSDSSLSDTFHTAIFRHLDTLSQSWKDRFTLTEIAQEAFSGRVDAYRLSAKLNPRHVAANPSEARASVRTSLPAISLVYQLPWPVRIIVPDSAIDQYRVLSTFLLQLKRAIYVLTHPILNLNLNTPKDSDFSLSQKYPRYYLLKTKILWFCNILLTYLTTLVFIPATDKLTADLRNATDVDEMVTAHRGFLSRLMKESFQGTKLEPIREAILDVLDLAIKMEHSHQAELVCWEDEDMETSRLSAVASPYSSPVKKGVGKTGGGSTEKGRRRVEDEEEEKELEVQVEAALRRSVSGVAGAGGGYVPYPVAMRNCQVEFERHLRFVAGGLRGVARASREEAAAKWDLLAEMLEVGIKD